MALPVNVYVVSDVSPNPPIQDVMVGVYDPTTLAEVAMGLTDVLGKAAFLLEPGTYEVRLQKINVRFLKPYSMEVTLAGPNGFTAAGTLLTLPASTDPRCCKVSARFVGLNNQPIPGVTVRFASEAQMDSTLQYQTGDNTQSNLRVPVMVDGNGVSAAALLTKSDTNGFVQLDLLRGGVFWVTFSGEDDQLWKFMVPDRSSANLFDLIHPRPVELTWDEDDAPSNAVSLDVGEGWDVGYYVDFSDFLTRTTGFYEWLEFTSSNSDIVTVADIDGAIVLMGVAAGTATISVREKTELHPKQVGTTLVFTPLAVTVT